jgi:hypothetical protein
MKKTFDQVTYVSPAIEFLSVDSEGVLCSSTFDGKAGANHFGYTRGDGIDF